MPLIRVAAVGLYFGTILDPATPAKGSGVDASKFRSAPQIDVPPKTTVKKICKQLSHEVGIGKFPAYSRFKMTPNLAGTFIRKIEVGVAQPVGPLASGTYSITDSSDVSDPGYKFAWQTYFFDKNFDQKNTDGTTMSLDMERDFSEGDLLLFRCLVIVGPNPIDVVAPGNTPALIT